jgi:hypothetical protein
MSSDTNVLHRSAAEVVNFESPEEEFAAEDSPITYCLPGRSFNSTAAICFLSLKCYRA